MRAQRPQALSPADPHSPPSPGSCAARGPTATSDAAGGGQGTLVGFSGSGPNADPGKVLPAPRSAHETLGGGARAGREQRRGSSKSKVFLPRFNRPSPKQRLQGMGAGGRAAATSAEGFSEGGVTE